MKPTAIEKENTKRKIKVKWSCGVKFVVAERRVR